MVGATQWALALFGALMLLSVTPVEGCGRGAVYIQNNGYRDILIAIGEDVPETPGLIERIKEIFTATSQVLYQATRRRAYLSDVKILVPASWSPRNEYEAPGLERVDRSDILVSAENYTPPNKPFVIKATPCGEAGHYMHLTPQFLLDPKVTNAHGPAAKLLVQLWAQLRYGVFEESPTGREPHFYSGLGGTVEATRCSSAVTGGIYNKDTNEPWCRVDGPLPGPECRFRVDEEEEFADYASLMYRQNVKHISGFCDNDKNSPRQLHNAHAPNQQNRKCDARSVWEVMRSHKDFLRNNNPPREINDTAPTFTLLRAQPKRYVLVLDRSTSMIDVATYLPSLRRGCSNFIRNVVNDGEKVGIVWIAASAIRSANLTVINTQTRTALLKSLNVNSRQYTCIGCVTNNKSRTESSKSLKDASQDYTCVGCGIREAIKVLQDDGGVQGGSTRGGHIIVITDGAENRSPFILEVLREVYDAKVTVHSIAFTKNAEKNVDKLAKQTGGLSFLYSDTSDSNVLNEAFRAIADMDQDISRRQIPLSSVARHLDPAASYSGQVLIDSTLGRDSHFIVDYGGRDVDVILTAPGGTRFTKTASIVQRDAQFGLYSFRFRGLGEVGTWKYTITNIDGSRQKVAVTVVSKMAGRQSGYPVMAHAYWAIRRLDLGNSRTKQAFYVSVSQGFKSVLNADVEASIERPDDTFVTLRPNDNGVGADQFANDGIYSAYFVDFTGNNRYNVKVMVNSKAATVISSIRVVGRGAPPADITTYSEPDVRVTNLQRSASGGSFQLENYSPPRSGKFYLPGQVTDLEVRRVDLSNGSVHLTWTAQGGELDKGKVSRYELRYSTDFESIQSNFNAQPKVTESMLVAGTLTRPAAAGHREWVVVQMPEKGNVTYVFRLTALDWFGRSVESPPSNLASAGMRPFTSQRPPPSDTGINGGLIALTVISVCVLAAILVLLGLVVNKHSGENRKVVPASDQPISVKPVLETPTAAPLRDGAEDAGVISVISLDPEEGYQRCTLIGVD